MRHARDSIVLVPGTQDEELPASQAKPQRRQASASFDWVARCLTEPSWLTATALDLLGSCEMGSRHFAANGRSVGLSEAPRMALEIRLLDLEKDETQDAPAALGSNGCRPSRSRERPETRHADPSGSLAVAPSAGNQASSLRKKASPRQRLRVTLQPTNPARTNPALGPAKPEERHFVGANAESPERPLDQFRLDLFRIQDGNDCPNT